MKKICFVVTEKYAIKRLMQNFDLTVDEWTDRRTKERKDLQMAKWAEGLNFYIPEILCMPYARLIKLFQKQYNNRI